jgi:hypothetical protein
VSYEIRSQFLNLYVHEAIIGDSSNAVGSVLVVARVEILIV